MNMEKDTLKANFQFLYWKILSLYASTARLLTKFLRFSQCISLLWSDTEKWVWSLSPGPLQKSGSKWTMHVMCSYCRTFIKEGNFASFFFAKKTKLKRTELICMCFDSCSWKLTLINHLSQANLIAPPFFFGKHHHLQPIDTLLSMTVVLRLGDVYHSWYLIFFRWQSRPSAVLFY